MFDDRQNGNGSKIWERGAERENRAPLPVHLKVWKTVFGFQLVLFAMGGSVTLGAVNTVAASEAEAAAARQSVEALSGLPEEPTKDETEAESKTPDVESNAAPDGSGARLAGQVDAKSGESRRNENVRFNLVDNNALKEMNVRLGTSATIINEFRVDQSYFGSEYGNRPTGLLHLRTTRNPEPHGDLFWDHNNSVFSARSFFQVGSVKPAKENLYGMSLQFPVWESAFLTVGGSQNKIRGSVNGNVLIPLPEERVPLTDDPVLKPIVQRLLDAYPNESPNRTDIGERAHNTSSLQSINTDVANLQLDQSLGSQGNLILQHGHTGQRVDAFQLVQGQNPDTSNRNHRARMTWNKAWDASTVTNFSLGYDRQGNLLVPAEGALGPVLVGRSLTTLGPAPAIPIDRVQNRFRYGAHLMHSRAGHTLNLGVDAVRLQYNGEESGGHRGTLRFGRDFGRNAITNLRMGTPSTYAKSVGTTYRGFRSWQLSVYFGDRWNPVRNLTVDLGLRYEPSFRPVDVTGRSDLAFDSDLNNWGPRMGLAYRLPGRSGTLRAGYGLFHGQIFPVAYGQDRLNPPDSIRMLVPAPDLRDPLAGIDLANLDPDTPASWSVVDPELATPYSHQYNLSWEVPLTAGWSFQAGYVGSRSHKLFLTYFENRARYVEGVPFTSQTINQRRSDQTRQEVLLIHNGSRAYFDAARLSLVGSNWNGLSLNASYWISKSLDLGGSYSNTASGRDARGAVAQVEGYSQQDLKALSDFDQPHSFLVQFSYQMPDWGAPSSWLNKSLGMWNFAAVVLAKTGTPFTVDSGSDGPGSGNVDGRTGDRPVLLDPSILGRTIGHPDQSEELLPQSMFRFINAPEEMLGNLGRNTFRKGGISNVNASLWRSWAVGPEWDVSFRVEAINLTNTAQFAEPGSSLTSPNFGQINNTLNDGRTFRFRLNFSF